ncbi:MAG: aldehyde dehydrogenase family protein [Idiomarina sp.]
MTDLSSLRHAFASGITKPLAWRREQLGLLQQLLREHETELMHALQQDLGKPAAESWSTELGFLHRDIRHTLKNLSRWSKPQRVKQTLLAWPGRSEIRPEPLGVVLILGAWNYPLQLLLSPLVAATAAGNCAVIKPSELAPATAALLEKLIPDYLSGSCVRIVTGDAEIASKLLEQRFDHIFYTGGSRVGKIVMRAASEFLTPVTLELGGKSPAVVLADADLKVAAKRIAWGKWLNAGQTCIAPDYLLVEDAVYDKFIEALKSAVAELYGEQVADNPDFGKIINAQHWRRLDGYLSDGKVAYGGQRDEASRFFAPTLLTDCSNESAVMQEEIFGPILPIVKIRNLAEAIDLIQARPKPLALYGFTTSAKAIEQLEQVAAGSQCFNDTLMFMLNHNLPFGGVGNSGMGRYHGYFGFTTFSHMKAIMKRSSWPDPDFRYPPYTGFKDKLMRWLTGGSK